MSALSDTITRYIPFAPKRPKIDRKQALAIVPMRNPRIEWERKDNEVHLTIRTRQDRLARIVKRLVRGLPDSRQVALDEVGSTVWELCDGERSIESVVQAVSKSYKLTRREAEASVTLFLQTLAKRGYIGLLTKNRENAASDSGHRTSDIGGKTRVKRKR